ncbi:MAG: hypothetical protein Q7U11_17340, partial [Phenylobacterium sp.]|nr:hypothetical protein [Phenylobacterium sp.]
SRAQAGHGGGEDAQSIGDLIGVPIDGRRRDAVHEEAACLQEAIASLVVNDLHCVSVTLTVNLDDEPGAGAEEVQDVGTEGMLASKWGHIRQPTPKARPKHHLRFRHGPAQGLGALRRERQCAHRDRR